MKGISRRQLLRYTTGALTTGVAVTTKQKDLQAEQRVLSPETSALVLGQNKPGARTGAEALPSSPLSGPEGAGESYKLRSQGSAQQSFGIVQNFSDHISDREDVRGEILYWLTDGRASFLGGAGRFQFLEHLIRPMYEDAGIPMELGFGLGMQESLFRNYSVSSAYAKGIWQMQWAGKKYGLRGGDYFDVAKSTQKHLEYLKDLVRVFKWNLELVLVDYNYGPGQRFARYRSNPHAFRRIYHRIPQQTRRFVPRVLAAVAIGLEPERYGMFLPRPDTRTVEVLAPREIHHLELALLLGTDHWNLGNLNPRKNIRVWFKEGETLVIPTIHKQAYYERTHDHPLQDEFHQFVADVYPVPGQEIRYIVKRGDNLGRIAKRFRQCVRGPQHIMLYNGLTSTVIHPGQKLIIPCTDG